MESTEVSLRKELDETKNLYIDALDSNRRHDSANTEIQRQFKYLQNQHRELEMEHETFRVKPALSWLDLFLIDLGLISA